MTKSRVVRYTVYHPEKDSRIIRYKKFTVYKGFESPRTMRQAKKIAERLGKGTIIEQLSRTRSGKLKVRTIERIR